MPVELLTKYRNSYLKPSSCAGCPFEHYGRYYTPDVIVEDAEVFLLGQAPGDDEEHGKRYLGTEYGAYGKASEIYERTEPQPLIGKTGYLLDTRFLPLSGLSRQRISVGNALRCRPGLDLGLEPNGLPPLTKTMKLESSKADIVKALRHCTAAHLHVPHSTKLVVTMGIYAMFALTGIQKEDTEYGQKHGVMESWRGYGVDVDSFESFRTIDTTTYHPFQSNKRIFFTMHLAALYKGERGNYGEAESFTGNRRFWHAALLDFSKIKAILAGTWPQAVLPTWSTVPPALWPKHAAFDTEYLPEEGNKLTRWSLCDNAYNLYCVEAEDSPYGRIPIEPGSVVLMQNALADIPHLRSIVDIHNVRIEDLMLADSVLYTGEPHSLNYIQSKYGTLNRHKHLSEDNPQFYSAIDSHQPLHMWLNHYIPEFKRDPLSWKAYRQYTMPLIQIIEKAQQRGCPVDTVKLAETRAILQARIDAYQEEARALTGNVQFNLGGRKYMQEVMYD